MRRLGHSTSSRTSAPRGSFPLGPGRRRRGITAAAAGTAAVVALLAGATAPAGATVTKLSPVKAASGAFLDTSASTNWSGLAVDQAGGMHLAFDHYDSVSPTGSYAYCPPSTTCGDTSQWAKVPLISGYNQLSEPGQIRLTADGKPRILFSVVDFDKGGPGLQYWACDSGCTSRANWTGIDLTGVFQYTPPGGANEAPRQAHSFALDSQGRPRVVFKQVLTPQGAVPGLGYAYCDVDCTGSSANWHSALLNQKVSDATSGTYYYRPSLAFTSSGQPRVADFVDETTPSGTRVNYHGYLECNSSCTDPANWSMTAVSPANTTGNAAYSLVLRLDHADNPHLAVFDGDGVLSYLSCHAACTAPGGVGWSGAPVGLSPGPGGGVGATDGADPDLAFDRQNRPRMAFALAAPDGIAVRLGYGWCDSGCEDAAAAWKAQVADDGAAYNAISTNPSCSGRPPAFWSNGGLPSLALDATDNPRISSSAAHFHYTCSGHPEDGFDAVRVDRFNFDRPAADFDGDGTTDVAVFRPGSGTWYVRNGATVAWGTNGDVAVPADYDGDGKADVAVFRPGSGTWFVRGGAAVSWGTSGDVAVPADYDGDGKADVAVFRPGSGTWFIHQSSGADLAVNYGTSGDAPVPADYDGDGKADVAVFRPGSGTWFIHQSSGADVAVNYGTSGDVPVAADYDGDHKADVAVFRPSAGTWYVLGGASTNWGTDGDRPVPGHYAGTGQAQVAVFRPASGTWFVKGGATTPWGTSGDVPLARP